MAFNINQLKDWITFSIAVVACVAGVIFWVQASSDSKIENLEKDIAEVKVDIKSIQDDNREIIRIIGRLEGMLDK